MRKKTRIAGRAADLKTTCSSASKGAVLSRKPWSDEVVVEVLAVQSTCETRRLVRPDARPDERPTALRQTSRIIGGTRNSVIAAAIEGPVLTCDGGSITTHISRMRPTSATSAIGAIVITFAELPPRLKMGC